MGLPESLLDGNAQFVSQSFYIYPLFIRPKKREETAKPLRGWGCSERTHKPSTPVLPHLYHQEVHAECRTLDLCCPAATDDAFPKFPNCPKFNMTKYIRPGVFCVGLIRQEMTCLLTLTDAPDQGRFKNKKKRKKAGNVASNSKRYINTAQRWRAIEL